MTDPMPAEKETLLARRPRTRRVFSREDMERMHALYYDPGWRVSQVAAQFGVPASTLLRWIDEMNWPTRKQLGAVGHALPVASTEPSPQGTAVDPEVELKVMRVELAATARWHLQKMSAEHATGPQGREREARTIATLARAIERLDKSIDRQIEMDGLRMKIARLEEKLHGKSPMREALEIAQQMFEIKLQEVIDTRLRERD